MNSLTSSLSQPPADWSNSTATDLQQRLYNGDKWVRGHSNRELPTLANDTLPLSAVISTYGNIAL